MVKINNNSSSSYGSSKYSNMGDFVRGQIQDEIDAYHMYREWATKAESRGYDGMARKLREMSDQEQRHGMYLVSFGEDIGVKMNDLDIGRLFE